MYWNALAQLASKRLLLDIPSLVIMLKLSTADVDSLTLLPKAKQSSINVG